MLGTVATDRKGCSVSSMGSEIFLSSVMSCVRMTFLRNVFFICLFFLIYHSVSRAITYFNARLSLKNDVNNTLIGQCGTFIIYIYHANKQNKN